MGAFDFAGALKAGYSESEIADHLAQDTSFDVAGARKAGYSDAEILTHITGGQYGKPPVEGGFKASVKQTIGATIKGAGQAAADFIPGVGQDNPVKRYGQEVVDANPMAVQSLGDILDKPWSAVKEAVGNAAGSMGGMLAVRAAGQGITAAAPLAGPAAPLVAGIGQMVAWLGPAAIAALPSFGGIRDKQIINDPENLESGKAKAIAALGAGVVGAIETKFGPQNWALASMTKEGRAKLAEKFATTTLGKSVLKGVGQGALIEGAEELVQNPIEQLAAGDDPRTKESLAETAFGGAMGAIGGGVIGGAAGGVLHRKPEPAPDDPGTVAGINRVVSAPDVDTAIAEAGRSIDEDLAAATVAEATPATAYAQREAQKAAELDAIQTAVRESPLPPEDGPEDLTPAFTTTAPATAPAKTAMQLAFERATLRRMEAAGIDEPDVGGMSDKELELAHRLTRSEERRAALRGEIARRAAGLRDNAASDEHLANAGGADAVFAGEVGETRAAQVLAGGSVNGPPVLAKGEIRGGDAAKVESLPNRGPANAEVSGDLGQAPPLVAELQRIAQGPLARTAVESSMVGLGGDHQILRRIVQAIPVDVMNNIRPEQRTPEHLFRNESVLKSLAANTVNDHANQSVGSAVSRKEPDMPVRSSTGHKDSVAIPAVRINGQLPEDMTVAQLQRAASEAPFYDQKDAAAKELAFRDRMGLTSAGKTVAQLPDKALSALVANKGARRQLKMLAVAEQKRRAQVDADLSERVKDPDVAEQLQQFADESGWAETGGRLIRVKHSERSGDETLSRTKWIPNAEWWPGRPVQENETFYREAVAKALAGEPLSRKQKQVVHFLLGMVDDGRTGLDVESDTQTDEVAEAHADIQEAAPPAPASWSTMSEAEKENELDEIFGADTRRTDEWKAAQGAQARPQDAQGEVGPRSAEPEEVKPAEGAVGEQRNSAATGPGEGAEQGISKPGGQSGNDERAGTSSKASGNRGGDGVHVGAPIRDSAEKEGTAAAVSPPPLDLATQTEADLKAKQDALDAAAAKKADEDAEAEAKRKADAERGDFMLSGSDRKADANPNQNDIFGAPAASPDPAANPIAAAADALVQAANALKASVGAPGIVDFGEKVGGARKDTARQLGGRGAREPAESSDPGWRKRFSVSQIEGSTDVAEVGRWVIRDTRKQDWRGQDRQVGGQTFVTREAAEKAVPLIALALKHRVVPVGVAATSAEEKPSQAYEIWRDVTDRKRVKVVDQQFATREDAMRYMAEHAVEIIETKTAFGEEILAKPETVRRIGEVRRAGPATVEMFTEAFGFRAVEFGLWNNQNERQDVMNHAYDGLLDLAEVLKVPPKALSLNGELALAFGARGQGLVGAKAHYERDYGIINLTKMTGAGSLAHEWFHALDHYLGRQDTKAKSEKIRNERGDLVYPASTPSGDMASHGFRAAGSQVRPELRKVYTDLIQTMFTKAEQYVEDTQRAERFVGASREALAKALQQIRGNLTLGPEQLTYMKRNNKPASAEQIATFDQLADRLIAGEDLKTEFRYNRTDGGPANRRGAMAGHFSNDTLEGISAVLKAVRGRSGFNAERSGTLDGLRYLMNSYSERVQMLQSANASETKNKRVPTSYAMENKKIDQGRASDYWTTEHEMAARAFSAYVEDKIGEQGNRSDFLAYGADNSLPHYRMFNVRPFPEGAERVAINEAFDRFTAELKTKETDKGVAMFSRAADTAFASEVLTELANVDELFRYPVSQASTLKAVFKDVLPDAKYYGEHSRADERDETGADHRHVFTTGKGKKFYVYTTDAGKVWIDVSQLERGEGGSAVYAAALNYAHNDRKVFVGDPNGVSDVAVIRRTNAMLSSALRFGTTRHMNASAEQRSGVEDKGIAPLDWGGTDVEKVRAMVDNLTAYLEKTYPDAKDARYDFDQRAFVDASTNEPITEADFGKLVERGRVGASEIGGASLKRGIFLQSLVRSESGARPRILEQVLRRARELVTEGGLAGSFSRSNSASTAGLSKQAFREAVSEAFGRRAADRLIGKVIIPLADQSKLPAHVVPFVRKGDTVYGFYDPRTDRTYAVLSNLGAADVRGLVLHELGVHYGMERMLGKDKYGLLMRRLDVMAAAGNRAVKDARARAEKESSTVEEMIAAHERNGEVADVAEVTAQRDALVREESLAYLVQNHPQLGAIRELIAAVKAFLFKEFGILGDTLTEADMAALAKASVQRAGMLNGEPVINSDPEAAFSRDNASPFDGLTTFRDIFDRFAAAVTKLFGEKETERQPIRLSDNTPASIQLFGFKDLPVVVRATAVTKMHYEHGMTQIEIARLVPETLKRPAMILQHKGQGDVESLRFVARDEKSGLPVIVAIQPESPDRFGRPGGETQLVATMFPESGGWPEVAKRINRGALLYRDTTATFPDSVRQSMMSAQKKFAREPRMLLGLIPNRAPVHGQAYKVLGQSDLVKWEKTHWGDAPKFARGGQAESETFRNETSLASSTTSGHLNLPDVVQLARSSGTNMTTEADVVNKYGPRFSRASVIQASRALSGFVDGIANSPGNLGIFNGINTQYHKAVTLARAGKPQFKAVFDRLQAYLNDINAIAVSAESKAPAIFRELKGIGFGAMKRYFKGAAKESDIRAIAPWLNFGTLYGGPDPLNGVVWTDDELRGRQTKGSNGLPKRVLPRAQPLTDAQIALYRQARAAIDQSIEDGAKAVIYRNVSKTGISFDRDMSLEDVAQTVRDTIDSLLEGLTIELEAVSDVDRTNDMAADIADMSDDGRPGGASAAADFRREQERRAKEIEKEIAALEKLRETVDGIEKKARGLIEHGYMPLKRFGNRTVTAKNAEGEVMYFATFDGTPLVPGSANAEMKEVAEAIKAAHPDWTVTTGIKAEKTWQLYQGLSIDALENFLEFLDPETRALIDSDDVLQEYRKSAANNRSVMKELIHRKGTPGFSKDVPRILASFVTSHARNAAGLYNLAEAKRLVQEIPQSQGDVADEATELVKYVTEPGEEAAKLRGFLFFHFLGGSVAAAAVNLTQTVMMTAPYLAKFSSVSDVTAAAISAAKRAILDPAAVAGAAGDALQKAELEGITAPQQIHHLTATAANNPFSSNRHFRTFMTVWGGLFGSAEVFNRRVAFLAAFDIARANGQSKESAYDFARVAVIETQGLYNKANRPNWSRGTAGLLVFTFKTFSIMYLELLKRLPPKQQLMMLGVLLLISGAEGAPFAEDIKDLVDTLGQWLGFSTNSGKWTGKVIRGTLGQDFERPILKGLGGVLPLDLHSRLGMGNLLPGTAFFKPSEIDKTRDVAEAVGPLGGVLKSLSDSLQMLARGRWDAAAVNASPKAVRDAYRGAGMVITGESTDSKGRLAMRDLTSVEGVGKALGFNPQRAAIEGEAKREIQLDKNLRTVRMDEIAGEWADGILRQDKTQVAEARDRLRRWNTDNPTMRIDNRQLLRSITERVRAGRKTSEERFLKSVPKPMRQEAREALQR